MLLALKLVPKPPTGLFTTVPDGRKFAIDFTTGMQETVFFMGEYEPFITELVSHLVSNGDVCVDAGANFGWYTTLLAELVGPAGSVHAFEPVPKTFCELEENVALLRDRSSVHLNQLALSDGEAEALVNVFANEPTGHASLAAGAAGSSSFQCRTISLDGYLSKNERRSVNFLKADVEGGELALLKGSEMVLRQEKPPLIVMEMSLILSQRFGYLPDDLIRFIGSLAEYEFYRIDETRRTLVRMHGFSDGDLGAYVLCVPVRSEARIHSVVKKYHAL